MARMTTATASTAAAVLLAMMTAATAVTVDNVAVRLNLPEGRGLSGVCLYRNGPDKRRRVMFKSVASARKRPPQRHDHVVAGDLAADRVYEGTFARLEDGDQVARFACKGGLRFEIATPFVVPDRDLDSMLTVKESLERRFGGPSELDPRRSVTAEHVSVTLRGLLQPQSSAAAGDDAAAVTTTVDVFQLYRKPTANAAGSSVDLWDNSSTKAAATAATPATLAQYSALPYARYNAKFNFFFWRS